MSRSTVSMVSALATEGSYDLILLDIMLPGRNGFQGCADLLTRKVWTPIIGLTAKDGDLDEAEALDAGADDYSVSIRPVGESGAATPKCR